MQIPDQSGSLEGEVERCTSEITFCWYLTVLQSKTMFQGRWELGLADGWAGYDKVEFDFMVLLGRKGMTRGQLGKGQKSHACENHP
jgi:hypothetical protein